MAAHMNFLHLSHIWEQNQNWDTQKWKSLTDQWHKLVVKNKYKRDGSKEEWNDSPVSFPMDHTHNKSKYKEINLSSTQWDEDEKEDRMLLSQNNVYEDQKAR